MKLVQKVATLPAGQILVEGPRANFDLDILRQAACIPARREDSETMTAMLDRAQVRNLPLRVQLLLFAVKPQEETFWARKGWRVLR